ncbi:MAG: hypothetical protein SFV54_23595 [Bryobacteraceae bacterium]|nr:hypothetical protein [Bryobacteraceae bacterium]
MTTKTTFLRVVGAMLAMAGAALAQSGSCTGSSLAGQRWSGARFGGNTSLTFESGDQFSYAVRSGARTMVSARGRYAVQRSNTRGGDRFPSSCQITFTPNAVDVKPSEDDLRVLQNNGLLDGREQTFWIEKKAIVVPGFQTTQ